MFDIFLKQTTFSKLLLSCVPLLDVLLLVATAVDLDRGTNAEFAHGLAAIYLGFSVVYGRGMIRSVDQYISYRFLAGEKPNNKTGYGWSYAAYEWKQWFKGLMACAVAAALLEVAIVYVGQPDKARALEEWFSYMFWVMAVWLVGWPVWYTAFPRRKA